MQYCLNRYGASALNYSGYTPTVSVLFHRNIRLVIYPDGMTKCVKAVSDRQKDYPKTFDYNKSTQTLTVGVGEFSPVREDVYDFEVSGLKVVQSWLKYRMKNGAGKKSSLLDKIRPERWTSQFTTELLELLWILTETVEYYPEQARLLKEVIEGEWFQVNELPSVPDEMRKAPKITSDTTIQLI